MNKQHYTVDFGINKVDIFKDGNFICSGIEDNKLYILTLLVCATLYNTELFQTAESRTNKGRISKDETLLWHPRLGHINLNRIQRLVKSGPLSNLELGTLPVYESCIEGKMTKRPFSAKGNTATEPLELIHSDLCGPMNVKARGGYEYYVDVQHTC